MPYIDSQGNIVESRSSFLDAILHFFNFIVLFLQSLFGPFFGDGGNQSDPRDRIRNGGGSRFGAGGGGSRWPDRGGPRGDESQYRRQIGRLPRSSGISAPPMSCLSGG